MAVNQRTGTQLACKIVSLSAIKSQLRPSVNCGVGQPYTRRPAANGDTYAQTAKLQNWSKRQQLTQKIESKLKIYDREVEILQKLRHPNIIGVERVFKTENTLYIFQDLIPAGDLFSYLEFKRGKLHDAEAAVIVRQIAIALDYLHDNNIVHRDLKPDNVLMTSLASGCRIVLTDFGCARHIPRETNRMVSMMGTFEYTAPEIDRSCLKKGYTKSVDLWSLGCVTVVLLTGGSPFQHPDTESYSRDLARECNLGRLEEIEEWFHVGRRAKDFVRKLLVLDENQRMTAKDAVKHDWFTNPFHKRAFEEIYQKGISEWKPRPNGNFNLRDSCYSDSESQIGLSLNNGLPSCNRSGSHIGLALDIKGQTDCASSRDKVTGVEEHAREQEQSLFTMPSVPGRKDKSPFHCHMHGSFDELTFEGRNQTQSELELQGGEAASIQEPNHGVDTDADAGTSSESKKHNSGVRISHQPFYGKLTYTPNKVESPVRLPFSPAAWNKDVGMTKLTRPMGPPNRINACSLRKTLGEPGSILKTLRPNSGALEARSNLRSPVKPSRDQFDQSKKRRRADIFDLEEDVLLQDSKHNAAGQKKRLK
ncbi:serine/threonine protein kinase [Emydomyces testavorans]|uniref:Serine/threonine protein kinase n=1 Tax=Emydomyces testavorans TaxID=2070801 RepID=A0AAF0DEP9_9EURO|nr:serine/threonine protein kinase [Emydomyces testavorans]